MSGRSPAPATAHFSADAIAAAQETPRLVLGNLLYRGRLLSIEEWLPFWERLQAMEARHASTSVAGATSAAAALRERSAFYREYLYAIFPRRSYRFWAPDPVTLLMRQPYQVVDQTLAFFFILQARATFGEKALARSRETDGTPSPTRTADGPTDEGA
jgi:hypothetical protein